MKVYPFPEKPFWKGAFALFLMALLFLCRDSMFATALIGFYSSQFWMLGLIIAAGGLFLAVNRRNLKQILHDRRLLVMAGASLALLLPMVCKGDWQLMYFSVLLGLLLGIFLTCFVSYRQAAKTYVAILTVLGAYSVLAAYVLRLGVDRGSYSVPVFYNSIGIKFYNFFFSIVPDTYVKDRNFGIFREPGVYQFFLLLALYLNNDAVDWKGRWQQWTANAVLGLTMLTTFATGGVIEMGLLAVLLFFDKKWYRNRTLRLAAAALVVAAVGLVCYCAATKNGLYWSVYDMFIGKFQGSNESGPDRIQSITVNLKTFLESPLVGRELSTVLHALDNNTSSTMILFAGFGILGGGVHLAAWASMVWKKERHILVNGCYLVILLMSFNTQNLIADVFLWLFPMMALTERVLPLLNKKEETNGNP